MHAPLLQALLRRLEQQRSSFHVPGHQSGQLFSFLQASALAHAPAHAAGHAPTHASTYAPVSQDWHAFAAHFAPLMQLDLTELPDTDDLHQPETIIQQAQALAARTFGAEQTFFLVGGSTVGNLALLLSQLGAGELVLIQRNVHKSLLNGLMLSGAEAVFLSPQLDQQTGRATVPSLAQLAAALERFPHTKAVVLSTPNYYGMAVELTPYVRLAHEAGVLLLVDEAHGAHYGLHPALPGGALAAGADAVVQSTHKTLPALTMGAMLHVQGPRVDREALRHVLGMLQSSSPSYPIMASLDGARALVDWNGVHWLGQAIAHAADFRAWLEAEARYIRHVQDARHVRDAQHVQDAQDARYIRHHASHDVAGAAYDAFDPLRLVLWDASGTLSGTALLHELAKRQVDGEMADECFVVLLIGGGTTIESMQRLKAACQAIEQQLESQYEQQIESQLAAKQEQQRSILHACAGALYDTGGELQPNVYVEFDMSEPLLLKAVHAAQTVRIPLEQAAGRLAGEMVIPYPPGIPLLYPGERITSAHQQALVWLAAAGVKFQGAGDAGMQTVRVVTADRE